MMCEARCTLMPGYKQPFFWVDPQWSTSTASCSTRSFCTGPRTLLLDPIIFDMWIPGVLSWAPGQPCNSHHSRHTGQDTVVVPYLRGESLVGVRVHHSCWLSLASSLCVSCRVSPLLVCPSEYRHCLCFFCWFSQSIAIACVSLRVSPLLVFLLLVFSEYHHCLCISSWFPLSAVNDDLAVVFCNYLGILSAAIKGCFQDAHNHVDG